MYRGVYILYFKMNPPTFCFPLFSENYLNPWVRINKIVNKHTVDYRLSYFYGLLRAFVSTAFLEFSPKPVYSTLVPERFQTYSVKITANNFVNQKIESVYFYSVPPPRSLSLSSRQTGITESSRTMFLKILFPEVKGRGERIMELKKIPKLTRVLVTSFDKFHHLYNLFWFIFCCVII